MSNQAHEHQQEYPPSLSPTLGMQMEQDPQYCTENGNYSGVAVQNNMQLEIEELKRALNDKENQLISCLQDNDRQVELEDSIIAWQDKYERLYESHKRVQKVNQNLEDKLLKLVERGESKNAQLTSDVATLSVRLAQANYNISLLQREIERYKTDMGLAIQLLQCKPDGLVPQKINSHLPMDIQNKLRSKYMRIDSNSFSDSEGSTSGVAINANSPYSALPNRSDSPSVNNCTFQASTVAFSLKANDPTHSEQPISISPTVMVKFLEDELKSSLTKHCDTCKCPNRDMTVLTDIPKYYTVGTQTILQGESATCLRCNSNLNSPSHVNSPFAMKLVKSSDSVISETKSSVSDSTQNDKLFSPAKKDDLTVNPILGHHRLCDRANNMNGSLNISQNISNCGINSGTLITSPKFANKNHISSSSSDISKTAIKTVTTVGVCNNMRNDEIQKQSFDSHENSSNLGGKNEVDLLLLTDNSNDEVGDENDELCNEKTSLLSNSGISPVFRKSNNMASRNMILRTPELALGRCKNTTATSPVGPSTCSTAGKNNTDPYFEIDKATNKSDSLRGAGNGSTNSLWSRTSSRDGSKIFENFNRNLIKTIKAENPKMKGPRICALRIQTGSNNILIDDTLEDNSTLPTPIMYTRRSRLLDEELDDDKEVTLAYDCKISMVMSEQKNHSTLVYLSNKETAKVDDKKVYSQSDVQGQYDLSSSSVQNVSDKKYVSSKASPNMLSSAPQQTKYPYSRTPNSSVSSEVDLKRQQLSRVAEWVQNNSKINDLEINLAASDTDVDLMSLTESQKFQINAFTQSAHLICNRSNTVPESHTANNLNNNSKNTIHVQNASNDLMNEITHADASSNTKPMQDFAQINQCTNENSINNNNSNNNNNNSGSIMNNRNGNNAKNSINLYKYFKLYSTQPDDLYDGEGSDDQDEKSNSDMCDDDYYEEDASEKNCDDENQIDLAQMEYNVKQFLLKQNEWSIHNKLAPGGARLASSSVEGTSTKLPQRTETNL